MLKDYYRLAKPGIVYGNTIAAVAGFFLAAGHSGFTLPIIIKLLLSVIFGLGFVIAGSAVFNNYIDRKIDSKMARTQSRPSVTGKIPLQNGMIYGACLIILGLLILYFFTNFLTFLIAIIGVIFYLPFYSLLKTRTIHSPLVGSIAGAVPPLVGFCAITNMLNAEALILFLIFVAWQMPHFYAIAIRKKDEYAAAGVPTLPVKKGIRATKISMLIFVIIFILVSISLTIFHYTGYIYLAVMLILGLIWFTYGIQGFFLKPKSSEALSDMEAIEKKWAGKMFFFSLIVMMVMCVALAVGPVLI